MNPNHPQPPSSFSLVHLHFHRLEDVTPRYQRVTESVVDLFLHNLIHRVSAHEQSDPDGSVTPPIIYLQTPGQLARGRLSAMESPRLALSAILLPRTRLLHCAHPYDGPW